MMAKIGRAGLAIIAGFVVITLIVVGIIALTSGSSNTKHVTAYFNRVIGLYTGNDVRILGVKVGHIESITPAGSRVKVVMSYDGDDKIPANADAVIITPSIVSDRYVQLTPAYTSGGTLPDNAVLPPSRTRIPLELDQIFGNLNSLNQAIGPHGANKHGALSRLVKVSAANLRGNGALFNRTFREFSAAVSTLSGGRSDLFGTITHLQKFTTTLANNDGGIRQLNANLAQVGGQLAGERKDLGAALANLATALSAVNNFVATNRNSLTGDIHGLTKVTNVLTKEKKSIKQFTDLAPFALSNLSLAYDPEAKTLDSKADASEPITKGGPSGAICQLLHTLGLDLLISKTAGCSSSVKSSSPVATGTTPGSTGGAGTPTVPPLPGLRLSHKHAQSLTDLLGVTK
jgi:phospholipid/cholesterol/gamma-HCH transport system substrate-binding protein